MGEAIGINPGYLKLRKIRAAQNIARTVAASQNRVYLNADSLMINLTESSFDVGIQKMSVEQKEAKA